MVSEILIGVLALGGAFVLGRLRARKSTPALQQQRAEEGLAYIRGVNFLLAGDLQQAIGEFVRAVQFNSETVETYLALGNLFRTQGDSARAIRIHQGITCRPGVSQEVLVQALYELGMDYRACGLLENARSAFQEAVKKDPKMLQAWVQLEEVQEALGQWEDALASQERISKLRKREDRNVAAHLLVELGKAQMAGGDRKAARSSFKKAISTDPRCVDAYLHMGDLYAEEGADSKAVAIWKRVLKVAPAFTFLAYGRLERAFYRMGQVSALEVLLREQTDADPFSRLFLARHLRKKGELKEAAQILEGLLQERPEWREARRELIQIYGDQGLYERALQECEAMAASMEGSRQDFQCGACGHRSAELFWKCPGCRSWDTLRPWEGLAEHVGGKH